MLYGFQMHQGEVVLHEFEQLYLAFVFRVTDNKQVYCIIWEMRHKEQNKSNWKGYNKYTAGIRT